MLFRIRAGDREFYLVRASERPVIKLAHEKSRGLPIGEKVAVFRGDKLIADILATSLEAPTDGPPNDPELLDERRHPCIDKPGTVSSADEAAIDKTDASIKTASNQPVQVREETNSGA